MTVFDEHRLEYHDEEDIGMCCCNIYTCVCKAREAVVDFESSIIVKAGSVNVAGRDWCLSVTYPQRAESLTWNSASAPAIVALDLCGESNERSSTMLAGPEGALVYQTSIAGRDMICAGPAEDTQSECAVAHIQYT